jgi:hypothetical protein
LVEAAAGHVSGVGHVLKGLSQFEPAYDEGSAHDLLERAAILESVNMRAAMALYEQIVARFPGTRAAREASQNLKTLRRAYPGLAPKGEK